MSVSPSLRIRSVRESDLNAICRIYNHYIRETTITFDEEELSVQDWQDKREALAKAGLPFLVAVTATEPATVLGYALVQPWRSKSAYRYSVEDSIYLDPHAVGHGIGAPLLQELLEASGRAGLREIIAAIEPVSAAGSIALHRRLGFEDAGVVRRVGIKFGQTLDVVFLQRRLDQRTG